MLIFTKGANISGGHCIKWRETSLLANQEFITEHCYRLHLHVHFSSTIFKEDLPHTVSPNIMLILSTYKVALHPSYLQRVFSFIIIVKEIYSFTILSENSPAPGGAPWAELKSDEHLSTDCQQNTDIWCCFTYRLQFPNHNWDLL